ncbi:4'-phosphopantetheinyl transferase family protein [Dinghuibacter silviterrae]|uniref:Phosphopantetheinyl transferase n=1 Tax=Dinghuibacter silviterrae TaxID=1539049 RepID=A0A4V3GKM6_9BACT|nr:4'-phosphopantetheinyl transferase superfamily protein [Dinghuibacter silviterrae]TDW96212.1 phosphopantetheinyl transferase [Dinghuibacter silviterrae]
MGLFFQQDINECTRLGVWQIAEPADFFLKSVPLQREISHPHKRLQHLAGRFLLRYLYPDFPYKDILIANTRKPYVPGESFHFSISHCGNFAAAIVSRHYRVGIDIEAFTPKVEKIIHKFLSPAEQAFLDPRAPLQHAIVCWGAKEAVYKWYGIGEMDFMRDMPLEPFTYGSEGALACRFSKQEPPRILPMRFKTWRDMAMVHLVTEP